MYLLVTAVGVPVEDHWLLTLCDRANPALTGSVGTTASVVHPVYPPHTILPPGCSNKNDTNDSVPTFTQRAISYLYFMILLYFKLSSIDSFFGVYSLKSL